MTSEILIKGMVCSRCVSYITAGITNLGYEVSKISLGKVSINSELSEEGFDRIRTLLGKEGFELASSRHVRIVNKVKELIDTAFAENLPARVKFKFSSFLSEKLNMSYGSISELFAELEGGTLEKYVITKRLEKVKELLVYTAFNLTEIAHVTGFSSINHLSRQFKQLTGLSPSHFKSVRKEKSKLSSECSTLK